MPTTCIVNSLTIRMPSYCSASSHRIFLSLYLND